MVDRLRPSCWPKPQPEHGEHLRHTHSEWHLQLQPLPSAMRGSPAQATSSLTFHRHRTHSVDDRLIPRCFPELRASSYTGSLQATGGTGAYTWSLSSGALPAGLTLAANGAVSGNSHSKRQLSPSEQQSRTPVRPPQTTTATVTLSIVAAGTPLAISSPLLQGGMQNQSYSAGLHAIGGTAPYTWSITVALPSGLGLTASTGIISGTPTGSGTANFTVTVRDSSTPLQTKSLPFFDCHQQLLLP